MRTRRGTIFGAALVVGAVSAFAGSALARAQVEEHHPESAKLPQGRVGFIRVLSETSDAYEVEIAFPGEYRDFVDFSDFGENEPWYTRTASIAISESISIFDAGGRLGTIPMDAEIRIRYWTENDGGPHYRPSAKLTLEKSALTRPLTIKEGYGAFVVHGDLAETPPTHSFSKLGKEILDVTALGDEIYIETLLLLEGDYAADGEPDARIVSVDQIDLLFHRLETRHSRDDVVDGGP